MEDYEKIRIVGRGAYGTVHLCRRRVDNYLVIIKQIPVEEMTTEERYSALNEVHVLSKFKHPNIIRYFNSFVEEKALMIVMEYAQGNLGTAHFLSGRGGLWNLGGVRKKKQALEGGSKKFFEGKRGGGIKKYINLFHEYT